MDVDFECITWNTKDGIADLTDALNVFGWPKHLFPDHQTIYALIREKYYNPIYLQKEDDYSEEFEHVKINQ